MREMKRDLDAANAPKVDQNLYYGLYYRFLDYSLLLASLWSNALGVTAV